MRQKLKDRPSSYTYSIIIKIQFSISIRHLALKLTDRQETGYDRESNESLHDRDDRETQHTNILEKGDPLY